MSRRGVDYKMNRINTEYSNCGGIPRISRIRRPDSSHFYTDACVDEGYHDRNLCYSPGLFLGHLTKDLMIHLVFSSCQKSEPNSITRLSAQCYGV